jgi:hypothetical protein
MRGSCILVLGFVLLGCRNPVGPTTALGAEFRLAPGQQAQIDHTGLAVRFLRVENDSRCPADALCITGGDALVKIEVSASDRKTPYDLHTGDMKPVIDGDFTIALVQLQPYPFGSKPTEPGDYRATLRVTSEP